MNKVDKHKTGGSLIETMVSIFIIIIITGAVSAAFIDRREEVSLFLFRGQLISDLRYIQVRSINSINNFGIFIESNNRYILFEDRDRNNLFGVGEEIRNIELPTRAIFASPSIGSNIIFKRDGSLFGGTNINITITNNVIIKNVLINAVGLIN